jgi:zinc-ribbon domain
VSKQAGTVIENRVTEGSWKTMSCSKCHAENADGLKFCNECGASLGTISNTVEEADRLADSYG